ncbi:kinase-like domain-containing protein [Rhizophagus irregularis DAOM 181602=DAOM 197198]|nr:kinase-like domain-containing protein [Rhizophagus irregularis DAOM 181602=DAOM 197198]
MMKIGSGGFGKVYHANWKNSHKRCAIKSFFNINDATIKAIVREIQLQREVDFHDNVIRFYGVTASIKADFGLLKRIEETSNSQSRTFGLIPYTDSKSFNGSAYLLNKKSDVYGVGVLLWEISSCQPPFHGKRCDAGLALNILQGLRETPIHNTPEEYISIYTACWNVKPDNRPTIDQVVNKLDKLKAKQNIIIKDFHLYNNDNDIQSSYNYQSNSDVISENIDSSHGNLSQIIQNFNIMNTKEIESSMSSGNLFENSFDTIVNDIINYLVGL